MDISIPLSDAPRDRAHRLKQARKLARLTLREMSESGVINFNTLCGWEAARHGGLTEAGARKVVERLAQTGVRCSVEWLLLGSGEAPTSIFSISQSLQLATSALAPVCLDDFIPTQIRWIEQQFPHFLGCRIQDRAMAPLFCEGDFVTGNPLPAEKMQLAVGEFVIAKLESGRICCRQLGFSEAEERFCLIPHRLNGPEGMIITAPISVCALVQAHFRYRGMESLPH